MPVSRSWGSATPPTPFDIRPTARVPTEPGIFATRNGRAEFGQQILGDTWIAHFGKFQKESTRATVIGIPGKITPSSAVSQIRSSATPDVNSVTRLTTNDTILQGQVLSGLHPTDPPVTDERKDVRMPFAWFKTYTAPSGVQGRSSPRLRGPSLDFLVKTCDNLW